MRKNSLPALAAILATACPSLAAAADDGPPAGFGNQGDARGRPSVQLGPRPYYLIQGMSPGELRDRLLRCENGPFRPTDFSIGHRGAALQFPEHTKESYEAAARQGAGIVECDVTFTKDGELVCRHAECDLHTTTNITATALNQKCSVPWTGPHGAGVANPAPAPSCCASDITLEEFRTLTGKMDASAPGAATAQGYLGGTAAFRTDLYAAPNRGTLLTLKESIRLNRSLRVKHTPELKSGNPERIAQVFGSQEAYAQRLIDTLKEEGVAPRDAWPQSFDIRDVLHWVRRNPAWGRQAVYLDDIDPTVNPPRPEFQRLTREELFELRRQGVRIFAPPYPALLSVDALNEVVPSEYARDIRAAGLDIITWSFERADLRAGAGRAGFYWYFDPTSAAIKKDSDMYLALDVLAQQVRVKGIFSDWPATVTYYANCMGL